MHVETWKPVLGYEGTYEVSDRGNVRTFARKQKGRLLKPGVASNGYYTVALGRGNTRTVHSLVAEAFLGPKPYGCDVMHIDGTRDNNGIENLRYGTRSENNLDTFRHGRRLLKPDQVTTIKKLLSEGESLWFIAGMFNVSVPFVSAIKHGRAYAAHD